MRYGIFSDIHGNLEALQAVLAGYNKENIDRYICLGDIVGYGADPNSCLSIVKALESINIAGNHDRAVIGKYDLEYFNSYAREAIFWTMERMDFQGKIFLEKLPLIYRNEELECVHGTLAEPEKFDYLLDAVKAAGNFALMQRQVCFVGHTHVPLVFALESDQISLLEHEQVEIVLPARYICNVGSVGQPRDGNPLAAYCIFDTKKKLVEIKRIQYNIFNAQNKIREAKLPEFLAVRISQGR